MRPVNKDLIPGFHAVREALIQGGDAVREIWIASGRRPGRIREIIQMAEDAGIPVRFRDTSDFSRLFPGMAHQGIAALVEEFAYRDLEEIMATALQAKAYGLLVVADHITDEGNLGALIRTAAFFGAHGLIIPRDRSARVSPGVRKRSSGAYLHLPVARVVNMGRALDMLKKKGFWIIGASGEAAESIYTFDWNRDLALILGNEKRGLGATSRKRCDQVVGIPGAGLVESLNVSVSGGIVLSEILRQRGWESR